MWFVMVPEEGVEPTRPCGHRILSPARLPVPPFRLVRLFYLQKRRSANPRSILRDLPPYTVNLFS